MRFLVFYQYNLPEVQLYDQRNMVIGVLGPAFEAKILEDVIFITDHNPRPPEIIDLTPNESQQELNKGCPISLDEVIQKIKNPKYNVPQATE